MLDYELKDIYPITENSNLYYVKIFEKSLIKHKAPSRVTPEGALLMDLSNYGLLAVDDIDAWSETLLEFGGLYILIEEYAIH